MSDWNWVWLGQFGDLLSGLAGVVQVGFLWWAGTKALNAFRNQKAVEVRTTAARDLLLAAHQHFTACETLVRHIAQATNGSSRFMDESAEARRDFVKTGDAFHQQCAMAFIYFDREVLGQLADLTNFTVDLGAGLQKLIPELIANGSNKVAFNEFCTDARKDVRAMNFATLAVLLKRYALAEVAMKAEQARIEAVSPPR